MTVTFNDTSNLQGLVQHLRFITGQDSLSIEDATRLLNFAVDDYSYIALTSDGKWKFDDSTNSNHPIATTDLEANQNDYQLASTHLIVDRVKAYLDGKWRVLYSLDRRDDRNTALTTKYEQSGSPSHYDYDGVSVFLYPTPNSSVSGGLKVFFSRPANYFDTTDTTATIGIPRIHHEYLALHAAHRLTLRTNDPNRVQIRQELLEFEAKIRDFFSKRDEVTARRLPTKFNAPR